MALPQTTINKLLATIREKSDRRFTAAYAFVWAALLTASNFCDDRLRGHLIDGEGRPLSLRSLAKLGGVAASTMLVALGRFRALGWLEQNEVGVWAIKNHGSWTVRESNSVRNPNGTRRNPNSALRNPNANVRESNEPGSCPAQPGAIASQGKVIGSLAELEAHLRQVVGQVATSDAPIDTTETARGSRVDAGTPVSSTAERQRPRTKVSDSLLRAVAVAFVDAVGCPFTAKDEATVAELTGEGHTQEEIVAAVRHFGPRNNVRMREAGLDYVKPMVRRGEFRLGPQLSPRSPASQAPSGNVTVGHTPELIAQRQAKRLARIKAQESAPERE